MAKDDSRADHTIISTTYAANVEWQTHNLPIPTSSVFFLSSGISEMSVVEIIDSPPYEHVIPTCSTEINNCKYGNGCWSTTNKSTLLSLSPVQHSNRSPSPGNRCARGGRRRRELRRRQLGSIYIYIYIYTHIKVTFHDVPLLLLLLLPLLIMSIITITILTLYCIYIQY